MTTHAQAPPTAGSRTLRLSLLPADACEPVEVVLQVPEGACWGEARAALAAAGMAVPLPSYIGDQEVFESHVIGEPPLLNAAVVAAAPTATPDAHLLELVAIEGPCTGARIPLTADVQRIGRATDADLVLADPDLSRAHLLVAVDQGRSVVTDAGSTNGSRVDDALIAAGRPTELRAGARLRAGSTTLTLERRAATPPTDAVDDSCRIPVRRPPRRPLRVPTVELTLPAPPTPEERRRLPWAMLLLPLVLAGVMLVVLRNPIFLMFALLSPLMMLGQHVSDRRGGSARTKEAARRHEVATREVEERRRSACATELSLLRRITPPLPETLRSAVARDERLWARAPGHADFLTCRLGIGTIASHVRVASHGMAGSAADVPPLRDAPVAVRLDELRVVGIGGSDRRRVADSIVLQVATWHSPLHVRVLVVCASAASRHRWNWAIPLPHLAIHPTAAANILDAETDDERLAPALLALLPERAPSLGLRQDDPPVHTVVVLDGSAELAGRAEIARLLRDGPATGVCVIALAEDAGSLPAECASTVRADGPTTMTVTTDGGHGTDGTVAGRPDLPTADLCRAVGRRLATLTDASPGPRDTTLPDSSSLLTLWATEQAGDPTDPASVAAGWAASDGTTCALLGVGPEGPLTIDLSVDGPHALIAGTTGAGKSELLQTLVTSLALVNRPDALVFVLIDYKGGAAFKDCAQLPHTVGLVTDLDAHLTERALHSLDAEVRRRERLLAAVGAKDLDDYRAVPGTEPLPRLVLVIDEFRVLAEELPDFITGLVRLAAVGRSLGIHLVLATQRPAGVVSADIRANVNLRIALRVRDEADSQDVIGTGRAAHLAATQPGRAIVRTGGGAPVDFQTARIGGRSATAGVDVRVGRVAWPGGAPLWDATPTADCGPTDLQRTVAAIRSAAKHRHLTVPASPWLPPLPDLLDVRDLSGRRRTVLGADAPADAIDFALADLPDEQTTCTLAWTPDTDGHLAIIGGPRSGRTEAVRTVAIEAALRWPDGGLAAYVIDGSGALGALAGLPQVGAVIRPDSTARLSRLVRWLGAEVRARQQASFSGDRAPHRVLLFIDGWESFTDSSDEVTLGRLTDYLLQVLRDGPAVGIHALVSGGRGLFAGRVTSVFPSRLVLRLADRSDAGLLGLRPAELPDRMPPGRALTTPDAVEVQIARRSAPVPEMTAAQHISSLATSMSAVGIRRFDSVPTHVPLTDLTQRPRELTIGIGGEDPAPVGLPLDASGELAALVCGPPRSGRTTTLRTIADRLAPDRPVCWLSGRAEPGDLPGPVDALAANDPAAVAGWLSAHPNGGVLADDVDELLGSPIEDLLLEHLGRSRQTGGIVCVSGQTSTLAGSFRGLLAELRRRQTGLILQPGRRDGELLGVDLGPPDQPRPGHGALVIRGRAVEIQVATDSASPTDSDDVSGAPQRSS
ncbi:FHA domain-containing protein [Flexivirga sp. ID2601S]|uniref:FHA domain-containing protein n=1 Tax=Flexivirga aerilata TaxID=1656889 RepID=A0A849AEB0_9MICO|nr:FtsK/SpoIIIE domain-containing protein [Flexivirga aerilata]NNG39204.1 FHA domain-containing protein [Flexivirga aerilata]